MEKSPNLFIKIIYRTPLIKGLPDCSLRDHIEAFKDVSINVAFSTAPIWLSSILLILQSMSPGQAILEILKNGELYMYCTSVLAPIFYLIHKEYDGIKSKKPFPSSLEHVVLVGLILMICTLAFCAIRTGFKISRPDLLFKGSLYLYFISLGLIYLATVYSNNRIKPYSQEMKDESDKFNGLLGERIQ